MRALLTPIIVQQLGQVILRPGKDLLPLFADRVLITMPPDYMDDMPTGALPAARQVLAEDETLLGFFTNEKVLAAAGGINSLEHWLMHHDSGCQWPNDNYHHHEITVLRYLPGAIRLCWSCDNAVREQSTRQHEAIAIRNMSEFIVDKARRVLGFDESHVVTLPELCWWATRREVVDALPEGMARKALGMPQEFIESVTREIDLVPSVPATSIVRDKARAAGAAINRRSTEKTQEQQLAKPVINLAVDPESPESFMKRPKRRRWENEKYTRWVKQQPCACCGSPADDPHHIIGYGMSGMGTKAHDMFVIPLCRRHHDELHADTVAFERKHGSQLELLIRFLDRVFAIGVIGTDKKNNGEKHA